LHNFHVYEASVAFVVVVPSEAPSSMPSSSYYSSVFFSLPDHTFFSLLDCAACWVGNTPFSATRGVAGQRMCVVGMRRWWVFCKAAKIKGELVGVCLQNDPSSLRGHQI
jgi:hypothetical protein